MITYFNGIKLEENVTFSITYKTDWCAGSFIKNTTEIFQVKQNSKRLTT